MRPDGTIVRSAGYDDATGRYLDLDGTYPSMMSVDAAVTMLLDVVCDFPFFDDKHRSAWVAALITMLSRAAFAGSSPLFLFDANMSRTGKGLLTDIIAIILTGLLASRFDAPTSAEEWNKVILAIALSGMPLAIFDNLKGKLGSPALENALTTGRYAGRVLGVSQTIEIAVTWGWMGTANNVVMTTDMIGRTISSRIESLTENPGERSDFKYPRLLDYVMEHRRELAIAALSIPAQFIRAGRPSQKLKAFGGFESWSDLVRQSIVWAGLPDCDSRDLLAIDSDTDSGLLDQFLASWPSVACKVGEALEALEGQPEDHPLRLAITELCGRWPDSQAATKVGNYLRDNRRRVVNGCRFNHTGAKPKWFVERLSTSAN